ncbi:unnamed protein product [Mycena citricolor]|uniref:Uncharacterized protein n=1 Tax=Mycena citricolor TaxID=2018698 RepID=A0AAD2HUC1_9AGAR|nr:unnamed protein product [Mycena citricolor]
MFSLTRRFVSWYPPSRSVIPNPKKATPRVRSPFFPFTRLPDLEKWGSFAGGLRCQTEELISQLLNGCSSLLHQVVSLSVLWTTVPSEAGSRSMHGVIGFKCFSNQANDNRVQMGLGIHMHTPYT